MSNDEEKSEEPVTIVVKFRDIISFQFLRDAIRIVAKKIKEL